MRHPNYGEAAAFLDFAAVADTDGCIIWPYSLTKTPTQYGQIRLDGRTRRAHVVICERVHGPCPSGLQAAHSCGRSTCVNPRHLRWATRAENEADKTEHGTRRAGVNHYRSKLTQGEVDAVRSRYTAGESQPSLARDYGIDQSNVSRIVRGRTYK